MVWGWRVGWEEEGESSLGKRLGDLAVVGFLANFRFHVPPHWNGCGARIVAALVGFTSAVV